jgi:hypothetical protein
MRIAALLFFTLSVVAQQPVTTTTVDASALHTREEFRELLKRYPPELPAILELDPTLFSNDAFMTPYPALRSYLASHPEIVHNPRFYLEGLTPPRVREDRDSPTLRFWRGFFEGFTAVFVFLVVTFTLSWLVKTLIAQRRWRQASRVQAEVHQKLMDRFTSSQELLAYIETPAGKRFLESAPIALEPEPRPVSAPLARILWSIQVGLVLLTGGAGMHFVSGRLEADAGLPLSVMGVVALSVGIGFVLSAVVSYALSRRLGMGEFSSPSGASE